ncbi:NADH-quinone oxidoreductase subunit C [Methylobacterium sp. J-078]|uniref:NADH-quinone oxidoreductase subunit C n=1 Tax=Methylobacterium sp. J-078 TaxID=2836657 RepID=UPI001FBA0163|nr:NADH-quinone oxidoreductase subunit C [Methylobacterium sp. J-078]MCJ2046632.1 NADH-quinone oxidoreductase subunit C [Methylobacterium sp. J-078]
MDLESVKKAEGGCIRALLGYQLLNMSDEDLVLLIRKDSFKSSLNVLRSEGWDTIDAIYASDINEHTGKILIVYRLCSNWRIHKTLGIQVYVSYKSPWLSASDIFPDADRFERTLSEEYQLKFVS